MGIENHPDSDGEFAGDYGFPVFTVAGPLAVLQSPTDL
jgi:hypothetical protein